MNNKGFAVTSIMYSILILFLMLILLILGNFQSRKVTFDKQKNRVLEKLEQIVIEGGNQNFCYSGNIQRFDTPIDGVYKLQVYNSNHYIVANVKLFQGIPLYVFVGKNGSITNIRTEENKISTVILECTNLSCVKNDSDDLGTITEITGKTVNPTCSDSTSGYVNISYLHS